MNETTAALTLLLGVLVVAALASRTVAIVASLSAFLGFNFFFLPPVGTFAISKRDDAIALFALLSVALIGSHLSEQAKRRVQQALTLARERDEADLARRGAEAKSALVASLSHDLKTPLTALTVATGNLGDATLTASEHAEQMQVVKDELRRLNRLFDNIVDLAGVERDAMRAEREWVPAAEIIEAAEHRAAKAVAGRAIEVEDTTGAQLVQLDPRLTSAALAHVVENAAAYSPQNTPITVRARLISDRLIVDVRDRGPGLPPGELERVFERGYRGATAASNPFGSGMGLTIARGLLAVEGGRLAASNHPDGGAVFTLDVPVAVRRPPDGEPEPA
jgi:two-component system sensor histidine kinase KdpD